MIFYTFGRLPLHFAAKASSASTISLKHWSRLWGLIGWIMANSSINLRTSWGTHMTLANVWFLSIMRDLFIQCFFILLFLRLFDERNSFSQRRRKSIFGFSSKHFSRVQTFVRKIFKTHENTIFRSRREKKNIFCKDWQAWWARRQIGLISF